MKFYLKDTKEEKEITVKRWNGTEYDVDYFNDLETNFPDEHDELVRADGGNAYLCTSDEYDDLKEWWNNEITAMNNGTVGDMTDYSECPDENITLFAD